MKTDLYTKAVLTVIAACLVWMCVNGATPVTLAQGQPQAQAQAARAQPTPVILVNEEGAHLLAAGPACELVNKRGYRSIHSKAYG